MNEHVAGSFPRQTLFGPAVAAADCLERQKKRGKKTSFCATYGRLYCGGKADD